MYKHFIALILLISIAGCQSAGTDNLRSITVLYTNDEHGWMEGMETGQGAADLFALWQEKEGFTADGPFLVLSGGDNFTGPAISTWVEGESMVEVMNAMGYDASAVGNHEFDFGLDALRQRTLQANYPYLSANTRRRDSGLVPADLGIASHTVVAVNDLKVAIIGLSTLDTPATTNPAHVAGLEFIAYEAALREAHAQLQDEEYDLLFVIAHVCMDELEPLAARIRDLEVAMMGGGHCNELLAGQQGSTVLLGGGYHFTAYATAKFTYDSGEERVVTVEYGTHANAGPGTDAGIAATVGQWAAVAGEALQEVLATGSRAYAGPELHGLIIDSWLDYDSSADIALTNAGGIRTSLRAGEITVNDVVSMLPFDNGIVRVRVPGAVVLDALARGSRPVVAGLEERAGVWVLEASGQRLDEAEHYTVLINSFMFAGGDGYGMFAQADPRGVDIGINYREPFIAWLRSKPPL